MCVREDRQRVALQNRKKSKHGRTTARFCQVKTLSRVWVSRRVRACVRAFVTTTLDLRHWKSLSNRCIARQTARMTVVHCHLFLSCSNCLVARQDDKKKLAQTRAQLDAFCLLFSLWVLVSLIVEHSRSRCFLSHHSDLATELTSTESATGRRLVDKEYEDIPMSTYDEDRAAHREFWIKGQSLFARLFSLCSLCALYSIFGAEI